MNYKDKKGMTTKEHVINWVIIGIFLEFNYWLMYYSPWANKIQIYLWSFWEVSTIW
jgi:hypothetical protein